MVMGARSDPIFIANRYRACVEATTAFRNVIQIMNITDCTGDGFLHFRWAYEHQRWIELLYLVEFLINVVDQSRAQGRLFTGQDHDRNLVSRHLFSLRPIHIA